MRLRVEISFDKVASLLPLVSLPPPLFGVFVVLSESRLEFPELILSRTTRWVFLCVQNKGRKAAESREKVSGPQTLLSSCPGRPWRWSSSGIRIPKELFKTVAFLAPPSDSVFVGRAQRDAFLEAPLILIQTVLGNSWGRGPDALGMRAFVFPIAFSCDALLKCRYDPSLSHYVPLSGRMGGQQQEEGLSMCLLKGQGESKIS